MSVIIGIGGEKAVGKDTAAAALVANHGFKRAAFADPLKEMCAFALNIPIAKMHDPLLKEKEWNPLITVYPHHTNRMVQFARDKGMVITKPQHLDLHKALSFKSFHSLRQLLQYVGTEGFRNSVSDTFWLDLFNVLHAGEEKVIVTDMRFPNEREFVKAKGGLLVRVKRPGVVASSHASENSLGEDIEYNIVLNNSDTIDDIRNNLNQWWTTQS